MTAAGHDAVSILAQRMGGQPDPSVAEVCWREARTLVTLDLDFADIRVYPPQDHAGLIVLRLVKQDKPFVLEVFARLIPLLSHEPVDGHLWVVDESSVRIRGKTTSVG